MAIDVNVIVGR